MLVLLAALVAPLVFFAGLAVEVTTGSGPAWDASLMRLLTRLGEPPVPTGTQRLVENSTLAGAGVVAGFVLLMAVSKRIREAFFVIVAVAGVVLAEPLLKSAFERQPPGDAQGFSFPSGSAMVSMSLVAAVAVVAWPTRVRWLVLLGGAAFVLAFGVAIVDLRWHYPSDVVGGWCVGLAWVSALCLLGRGRPVLIPSSKPTVDPGAR